MPGFKEMIAEEFNTRLEAEMSEEQHQIQLFDELRMLARVNPLYDCIFHIPNGGHRHKATAGRLKAMGVKSGIPDIFVPYAKHGYNGLFIELKSLKKGSNTSKAQDDRAIQLMKNGYIVLVCAGWRYALQTIKDYIDE